MFSIVTKAQALLEFKECVGRSYNHDLVMKREDWNNFIDTLHRDGLITDKQVNNWSNPF
jgi:hypothetical protein